MTSTALRDANALITGIWEQNRDFRWNRLYNECRVSGSMDRFHIAAKHLVNDCRSVLDYIGTDICERCGIDAPPPANNFLLIGIDADEWLAYYQKLLSLHAEGKTKEEVDVWRTEALEKIRLDYKSNFDRKIAKIKDQLGPYYDFIESRQPYNRWYGWLSDLNTLDNCYKHNAFPEIEDMASTMTVGDESTENHSPRFGGLIFQIDWWIALFGLFERIVSLHSGYLAFLAQANHLGK